MVLRLEKSISRCIISVVGCGSSMYEAAACHRQGGELLNRLKVLVQLGALLSIATSYATSTPAGFFYVRLNNAKDAVYAVLRFGLDKRPAIGDVFALHPRVLA